MNIRETGKADQAELHALHMSAFGAEEGPAVAGLAEQLLADETAKPLHSLVVHGSDGQLMGHVIFSKFRLDAHPELKASILAPLAVLPDSQRNGIGKALVERGLSELEHNGTDLVFVYGDPGYYGRYGFTGSHKVKAPCDLSYPHGWLALELKSGLLDSLQGSSSCAKAMMLPEYW